MFTRPTLLSNNRALYFKWSKFVCSLSILISQTFIGMTGFQRDYINRSFRYKPKQWNCTNIFDYLEHSLHANKRNILGEYPLLFKQSTQLKKHVTKRLVSKRPATVSTKHTLYLLVFKELWTVVLARPVSFTELTLSLLSCLTCFTGVIGFLNFQNERKKRKKEQIPVTDILSKKYQQT